MVVLGEDDVPLAPDLLPDPLLPAREGLKPGTTLREEVRRLEARLIGQALRENSWNKLRTARALHLSYPALLKKIREYKLDRRAVPGSSSKRKNIYNSV
jgi:DNA-binding NtrC family response regulator